MSTDTLREAFIAYLKGNSTVTALFAARLYPEAIPQKSQSPAAAISRTFVDRKRDKLGLTGFTESRVTVEVSAERKLEAARGSDGIESALSSFKGDMNGVNIKWIKMDDQDDFFDDTVSKYVITSVYIIWHENEEE